MSDLRGAGARAARLPEGFVPLPRSEIEQSIPSRFEAIVARHADRLAVKTPSLALRYGELDAVANRVAHAVLDRRGPGPEPIVLLFEHGVPFVVALLGVLKAGKFYVPMDPGLPLPRLADLLSDLGTRLILTDGAHLAMAGTLASEAVQVLDVETVPDALQTSAPKVRIAPRDFAYIVYTSGSTGRPKGVLVDHRGVLHYTMNYTNAVHYTAADRISSLNALTSNAAGSEIFPALLNGAALFPRSIKLEGLETLGAWLSREEITSYGSVPAVFRVFASALDDAERHPRLRLLRLGGDRLLRSDVELFKRHFAPDCLLRNGYGSAEILVARHYFIDKQSEVSTHVVPIGYAVEDTEILILDENRQPVGPDQVGEIAVKSRYLSPGYWRSPEVTAARFLAAPDGGEERIYLTGDLGRLLPDGCLMHLGRKDFQVKIRGKLVAPIEVENALLDLPTVQEAIVVAREDGVGESRLVAYFVPDQQPGPTVSEMREALTEKLPSELIPSAFVSLAAMPLTANRKIDRLALPVPPRTRPALATPFVGPRTPIERAVLEIWSSVLRIDGIGVQDEFLELGGDSLLATQVAARVIDQFAVEVSPDALLQSPTIEKLTMVVVRQLLDRSAAGEAAS